MTTDSDTSKPNVFRSAAEDGLVLGAAMSASFLCGACATRMADPGVAMLMITLSLLILAAVVVMAYRMLARDCRRWPSMRFFSAVWMHGIAMFFFGGLILCAASVVFMHFLVPTFITDNVSGAIEVYRQIGTPEATHMADTLQRMIDRRLLPTPVSVATSMIWLVTFLGSMLSLLLTPIVRATTRNITK